MAKERKSPQQKKELELSRDHFTPGWQSSRMFPRTWKRKKVRANREYRRKSEELLAQAKPGIGAQYIELIADDLTAARFQKSVIRKRLHKIGTVTVGARVKDKLERRAEAVGRNVRNHERYDRAAASTVKTLSSLAGEELLGVVRRAGLLCRDGNEDERRRVRQSTDAVDRALYFVSLVCSGSGFELDALRRNPQLDKALEAWIRKAARMLDRGKRVRDEKLQQKETARKKTKLARLRSAGSIEPQ